MQEGAAKGGDAARQPGEDEGGGTRRVRWVCSRRHRRPLGSRPPFARAPQIPPVSAAAGAGVQQGAHCRPVGRACARARARARARAPRARTPHRATGATAAAAGVTAVGGTAGANAHAHAAVDPAHPMTYATPAASPSLKSAQLLYAVMSLQLFMLLELLGFEQFVSLCAFLLMTLLHIIEILVDVKRFGFRWIWIFLYWNKICWESQGWDSVLSVSVAYLCYYHVSKRECLRVSLFRLR